MSEIKCLENYKQLKEMLLKGEKGDIKFFCNRLNISERSFRCLVRYYEEIEGVTVQYL